MNDSRCLPLNSVLIRSLLVGALVLAHLGCQPSTTNPDNFLQHLDPNLLVQRGRIQFINDASTGMQLARQQQLPSLLFFTAEWCTFCHQMEETAFVDATIGQLSQRFVCVLIDADRHPQLCQDFDIRGYPTLQFLDAEGRRLHRLVGRQTTHQLNVGMHAAIERLAWLDAPTKTKR